MDIEAIRTIALGLPEVTEEPHFDYGSFRVKGKIFVTVPPDQQHIHVRLDEQQRLLVLATAPRGMEALHWGKQILGIRVDLRTADPRQVARLVETAWRYRAPKRLAAAFDRDRAAPP
ncbi:MAG TPA: MmcQ/YjbR family DNA-binding protein [Dokdonella sp.]